MKPHITGEDLVAQTRTWIGTPYHHAGRVKGVGVDCIGLIVGAARELGVCIPGDTTAYGRGDNLALMSAGLCEFCEELPVKKKQIELFGEVFDDGFSPKLTAGDILIFRGGSILHHVALYAGSDTNTIIHVHNSVGKVVEQPVTPEWERLLFRVYRLRNTDLEREAG